MWLTHLAAIASSAVRKGCGHGHTVPAGQFGFHSNRKNPPHENVIIDPKRTFAILNSQNANPYEKPGRSQHEVSEFASSSQIRTVLQNQMKWQIMKMEIISSGLREQQGEECSTISSSLWNPARDLCPERVYLKLKMKTEALPFFNLPITDDRQTRNEQTDKKTDTGTRQLMEESGRMGDAGYQQQAANQNASGCNERD
ncbi:hypothetical protein WISP_133091 [Willisornis vidua]|uniref:Uncharacterized protein n=1 Tax=Willisornis vidua TaxID=1566151 RepID=A0ABQ9CTZ0_9PASS|nr:hypothetical protein WISP_133091 [Willisornis vidua]